MIFLFNDLFDFIKKEVWFISKKYWNIKE